MIGPAIVQLADELAAAGVRAAVDPRNLNPPCAWVKADKFDPDTFCSALSGQLTVDVWLLAANNGVVSSHTKLSELLEKALTVVDPTGPVEIDTVTLPSGGDPLPAYRIPTILDI